MARFRTTSLRPLAALALLALVAGGCRHASFWPRAIGACPGALRPAGEIAGDRRLELRMRVRAQGVDTALRLAVEKRGDELRLVGLSPLGAVLFSVIQRGGEVAEVQALPASVLDVPPRNVLWDLHRVLFLGVEAGPDDGERSALRDGTRVTELWQDGALRRRTFEPAEGSGGAVVIDFDPQPAEGLAAAGIHAGRCGYQATLVTLTATASASAPP